MPFFCVPGLFLATFPAVAVLRGYSGAFVRPGADFGLIWAFELAGLRSPVGDITKKPRNSVESLRSRRSRLSGSPSLAF